MARVPEFFEEKEDEEDVIMCRAMDEYRAKLLKEGREVGREEGRELGREEGRIYERIEMARELNLTKDVLIAQLMYKFDLSKEKAEEYIAAS